MPARAGHEAVFRRNCPQGCPAGRPAHAGSRRDPLQSSDHRQHRSPFPIRSLRQAPWNCGRAGSRKGIRFRQSAADRPPKPRRGHRAGLFPPAAWADGRACTSGKRGRLQAQGTCRPLKRDSQYRSGSCPCWAVRSAPTIRRAPDSHGRAAGTWQKIH